MNKCILLSASAMALGLLMVTPAAAQRSCDLNGVAQPAPTGTGSLYCGIPYLSQPGIYQTNIGNNALTQGVGATVLGYGNLASTTGNSFGWFYFNVESATAIGFDSAAVGLGTIALGDEATAGFFNGANILPANHAIAVGSHTFASAVDTIALGYSADATAIGAIAFGANAGATAANSVALGTGSVANQANTVSLGTVGSERRIVNVAAATGATDAVNLGQMQAADTALQNQITTLQTSDTTQNGQIATLQASDAAQNGRLTAVETTNATQDGQIAVLQASDTTQNSRLAAVETTNTTQSGQITALQASDTTQNTQLAALNAESQYIAINTVVGTPASATGTNAIAIGNASLATGANGVALGNGASDGGFANSVALGAGSTNSANNQVNVGGRTIGGVANGVATTDAVNVGQLNSASAAVNTSISAINGSVLGLQGDVATLFDMRKEDRKDTRQGIASAMALPTPPMPSTPGGIAYAVNGATFRGEYAGGASLTYRLNTASPTAINVGVAIGGNNNSGARIGISGEF